MTLTLNKKGNFYYYNKKNNTQVFSLNLAGVAFIHAPSEMTFLMKNCTSLLIEPLQCPVLTEMNYSQDQHNGLIQRQTGSCWCSLISQTLNRVTLLWNVRAAVWVQRSLQIPLAHNHFSSDEKKARDLSVTRRWNTNWFPGRSLNTKKHPFQYKGDTVSSAWSQSDDQNNLPEGNIIKVTGPEHF